MNRPVRICIDRDINYSISSDSSLSRDIESISNESISPLSSNSPIRRVPVANRIWNIARSVTPFDVANDQYSLSTVSENSIESLSTDNSYFEKKYNYISHIINLYNISIFFLFSIVNKNSVDSINPDYSVLFFYSITSYPDCLDVRNNVFKLFTYSLVHNGIFHILGNSLFIYFSTIIIFRFQENIIIYLVYFLSIVNGALSFNLTNPYDILIGCSGGVYGLFGSNISNFILNNDNMYPEEKLFTYLILLLLFIIDLINYFLFFDDTIAYQVHYFSFLFGLLSGCIFFKTKKKKIYKKYITLICICLYSYLNAFLIYHYVFNFPSSIYLDFFKLKKTEDCCFHNNQINSSCENVYTNDFTIYL